MTRCRVVSECVWIDHNRHEQKISGIHFFNWSLIAKLGHQAVRRETAAALVWTVGEVAGVAHYFNSGKGEKFYYFLFVFPALKTNLFNRFILSQFIHFWETFILWCCKNNQIAIYFLNKNIVFLQMNNNTFNKKNG